LCFDLDSTDFVVIIVGGASEKLSKAVRKAASSSSWPSSSNVAKSQAEKRIAH